MNNKAEKAPKSTLNIILAIIAAAAICLLFLIGCIYLSGIRRIAYKSSDVGTIKYFGKVDSSGTPSNGKFYYSNGETAQIVGVDPLTILYSNGDVYEGNIENLGRTGEGFLTFANGDTYEGEFKDNTFNGKGIMKYINGDIYEGEFVNGKKEGHGVYKWKVGTDEAGNPIYDVYDGEFKNDKKNGACKRTWADGSYYEGTYVDDIKEGSNCIYRFANGDIYKGDFKNDVRTGHGTYTWANGESYTGEFLNSKMHGEGTYTWPSGREYHGFFENGVIVRATETEGITATTDESAE